MRVDKEMDGRDVKAGLGYDLLSNLPRINGQYVYRMLTSTAVCCMRARFMHSLKLGAYTG